MFWLSLLLDHMWSFGPEEEEEEEEEAELME